MQSKYTSEMTAYNNTLKTLQQQHVEYLGKYNSILNKYTENDEWWNYKYSILSEKCDFVNVKYTHGQEILTHYKQSFATLQTQYEESTKNNKIWNIKYNVLFDQYNKLQIEYTQTKQKFQQEINGLKNNYNLLNNKHTIKTNQLIQHTMIYKLNILMIIKYGVINITCYL